MAIFLIWAKVMRAETETVRKGENGRLHFGPKSKDPDINLTYIKLK